MGGELEAWQNARVIKGNPDKAQRPLRQLALEQGKTLYMAVPRLRQEQCFVELDPSTMGSSPAEASTISGAFPWGGRCMWRRCGRWIWSSPARWQ